MILNKLIPNLHHRYGISPKSIEIQNFSERLRMLFNERYAKPLSYLQQYHIRKDIELVHSIQRKLRQGHYIIRVSDKSGVFHIGSTMDYDIKVKQYQLKTNAYIELSSNPLMDTFFKVVHLLNNLRSKHQITAWQHKEMMPKQDAIELAYLYFIPKPHKVSFIVNSKNLLFELILYVNV